MVLPEGRGCGSHASVDGSYENRFWGDGLAHQVSKLLFRLGNAEVLTRKEWRGPSSYPDALLILPNNSYLESPPDSGVGVTR